MVKTEDVLKVGGVAAMLVLAMIAAFTQVGDTNLAPTYFCESREITAYCYSLSSTEKTCYTQTGNTGGKRCTEGWDLIPEPVVAQIVTSGKITCTATGCK